MLNAVIFYKDEEYNLYINDNKYHVEKLTDDGIECLTEKDAINLFKDMFNGEKKFLKKENDYDVYLDESGNKRYFKEKKEDFSMFFLKNGDSALLISKKDFKRKNDSKMFSFKTKVGAVFLICTMSTTSILVTIDKFILGLDPEDGYERYKHPYIYEYVIDRYIAPELPTTDEVIDAIYNSEDEDLTPEIKDYLANRDFINLVLESSDIKRSKSLRKKIDNIEIQYFTKTYIENNPGVEGYYDIFDPSTIHLKNAITDTSQDDSLSHEFVHLMQHNVKYFYISEASAEIMAHEFYNKEIIAYKDQIIRLCILMEIIGPEPIIESNFKGDSINLQSTLENILGPDKADDLLVCLNRRPDYKNIDSVNQKIDNYLKEMYQIVYNDDIEKNIFIRDLKEKDLNDVLSKRFYFNKNRPEYYNDYEVEKNFVDPRFFDEEPITYIDEKLNLEDINSVSIDGDYVKITKEEYDSIEDDSKHSYIKVRDDYYLLNILVESEQLNITSKEDLKRLVYNNKIFNVSFKDGSTFGFNTYYKAYGVHPKNIVEIETYPSIDKLFGQEKTKNI